MYNFDYAATSPIDEEALQLYEQIARQFPGNANSIHREGDRANMWKRKSEHQLEELLRIRPGHLFFTSGGTESNERALQIALRATNKKEIIVAGGEHASIHHYVDELRPYGYTVHTIPFLDNGLIDIDTLRQVLSHQTAVVALQDTNHEIGTIQPVERVASLLKDLDVWLHVDAVQSFGKRPLDSVVPLAHSVSISSHKIYGPKGIGALYVKRKKGVPQNMKSKTIDIPGVVAFTGASYKQFQRMENDLKKIEALRDAFEKKLMETNLPIEIFGRSVQRSPYVCGFRIDQIEGAYLMQQLSQKGFYISTGSACYVGMTDAAMTMQAMRQPSSIARQFVRISFGRSTTFQQIDELVKTIELIVEDVYT